MVLHGFIQTLRIQKPQNQIFMTFVSSVCQTKTKGWSFKKKKPKIYI